MSETPSVSPAAAPVPPAPVPAAVEQPAPAPPPQPTVVDDGELDEDRDYVAAVIRKQVGLPAHEARHAAASISPDAVRELAEAGRAGDVAKVRSLLGVS